MNDLRYESHELEHRQIPIIHRVNTISPIKENIANWHDNIELLFCLSGSGQVLCGGRSWPFLPGDLVTVNSNVIHRVSTQEALRYHVLIVDSGFLIENGIPVRELDFQTLVRSEAVQALFREAVGEITAERAFSAAAIRGALLRLVVYLARNHACGLPARRDFTDTNIKAAITFIRENYRQRLSLDTVAAEAGLSKYHFARVFKASTGMTVTYFINSVRCRNAQTLLREQVPVSQAALECGFENLSYFSRTFRRIIGCLPSEVK